MYQAVDNMRVRMREGKDLFVEGATNLSADSSPAESICLIAVVCLNLRLWLILYGLHSSERRESLEILEVGSL